MPETSITLNVKYISVKKKKDKTWALYSKKDHPKEGFWRFADNLVGGVGTSQGAPEALLLGWFGLSSFWTLSVTSQHQELGKARQLWLLGACPPGQG